MFSFNSKAKKEKLAHDLAVSLAAKECTSMDAKEILKRYNNIYTEIFQELDKLNIDDDELVRPC